MATHMETCMTLTRELTKFDILISDLRKNSESNKRGVYMKTQDLDKFENMLASLKSILETDLFKLLTESQTNIDRMNKAEALKGAYLSMLQVCWNDYNANGQVDKCDTMNKYLLTLGDK